MLSELLLRKIPMKAYGSGSDGWVVAVVCLHGRNINLAMVHAGFAEVYSGGLPKGFDLEPYRKAEEEARRAGRGMWASGGRQACGILRTLIIGEMSSFRL